MAQTGKQTRLLKRHQTPQQDHVRQTWTAPVHVGAMMGQGLNWVMKIWNDSENRTHTSSTLYVICSNHNESTESPQVFCVQVKNSTQISNIPLVERLKYCIFNCNIKYFWKSEGSLGREWSLLIFCLLCVEGCACTHKHTLASYTSSEEMLGLGGDLEGEDSTKTSSSMSSWMGFMFEDALGPGDFSVKLQMNQVKVKELTASSLSW